MKPKLQLIINHPLPVLPAAALKSTASLGFSRAGIFYALGREKEWPGSKATKPYELTGN